MLITQNSDHTGTYEPGPRESYQPIPSGSHLLIPVTTRSFGLFFEAHVNGIIQCIVLCVTPSAYSTQHDIVEIHPRCCICSYFLHVNELYCVA